MKRARRSSLQRLPLVLPAELTIYAVAELRKQWLQWLEAAEALAPVCDVDGAAVEQVDAAGLQLLISLSRSLQGRQSRLQVQQASTPLRNGCKALGLSSLLGEQEGAGA